MTGRAVPSGGGTNGSLAGDNIGERGKFVGDVVEGRRRDGRQYSG